MGFCAYISPSLPTGINIFKEDTFCRIRKRLFRLTDQNNGRLHFAVASGRLNAYLAEIDGQARELFFRLVKEYADRRGVTERLKVENSRKWVWLIPQDAKKPADARRKNKS